jgi:hypothetical protein
MAVAAIFQLAGAFILLLAGDGAIRFPGAAVVVGAAPWIWPSLNRTLLLRGSGAVRRLRWDSQGQFELDLAGGYTDRVQLCQGSLGTTHRLWLVLHGRRRYHVYIARDRAGGAGYAALRRCLVVRRSAPQGIG